MLLAFEVRLPPSEMDPVVLMVAKDPPFAVRDEIFAELPKIKPVKVGLSRGALRLRAACVALLMGLSKSEVLLQLPNPTSELFIREL